MYPVAYGSPTRSLSVDIDIDIPCSAKPLPHGRLPSVQEISVTGLTLGEVDGNLVLGTAK